MDMPDRTESGGNNARRNMWRSSKVAQPTRTREREREGKEPRARNERREVDEETRYGDRVASH